MTLQVYPLTQVVGPLRDLNQKQFNVIKKKLCLYPLPPHWPHAVCCAAGAVVVVEIEVEVEVGVDVGDG